MTPNNAQMLSDDHISKYIPARYQQATTDNEIAQDWVRNPQGVLYLYGPTGTGKSHTSWASLGSI